MRSSCHTVDTRLNAVSGFAAAFRWKQVEPHRFESKDDHVNAINRINLSAIFLGVAAALAANNASAREFVYVANQDQTVRAFGVNEITGALVALPNGDSKTGTGPIAITGSRDGRNVYTVNLTSSDISG